MSLSYPFLYRHTQSTEIIFEPPSCKNLYKICGKQIVLSHRLISAFDLHYIHTILSTVVVLSRNIKYLASSRNGFLVTRRYQLYMILFDLILYVLSSIFQLNRDGSSWVEPVLSLDKCVLLKDHNAVTPVRLETAVPRSRVTLYDQKKSLYYIN